MKTEQRRPSCGLLAPPGGWFVKNEKIVFMARVWYKGTCFVSFIRQLHKLTKCLHAKATAEYWHGILGGGRHQTTEVSSSKPPPKRL